MTEQSSATVETLTAEVRTLVVGSRQVTLSVAKQLDTVPLAELEVMGRVKLGTESQVRGAGTVIGTHRPDGSLAVAGFTDRLDHPEVSAKTACHKHLALGRLHPRKVAALLEVAPGGDVWVIASGEQIYDCGMDYAQCPMLREPAVLDAGRAAAETSRLHAAAAAAPLIVLAGLK